MKASEIIARARSLADLPNTKNISHDDELQSLNEAWRDCYQVFTEADDDFYVTEVQIALTAGMAVGTSEYLVPLPSDFYKLRYLDVRDGTDWMPVKKFTMSMKNAQPGDVYYRMRGANLWIIGGVALSPPTIRVGYYPPAAAITLPDTRLTYGSSLSAPNLALLAQPCYAARNRIAVYTLGGNAIFAESMDLGTVSAPVTLFTDAAVVSNLMYYKGYLYWIRGANIYRRETDLTAAFVGPVALTATADILNFAIYEDTIYLSTAVQVDRMNLDGTGRVLFSAVPGSGLSLRGADFFYIDGAGDLWALGGVAALLSNITACVSDGTYLYVLDTTFRLRRITLDSTPAVTADVTLATDVRAISQLAPTIGYLALFTREGQGFYGVNVEVDYDFLFPINFNPEILHYKCAIDFRSKQEKDSKLLLRRLYGDGSEEGLWARFIKVVRRDEYKHERIQNVYAYGGGR